MTPLTGIVPPVCTPRTRTGVFDVTAMHRLCDHLVRGGAHGLFVAGSTGEAALLDDATRLAALDAAVAAAAGRVPVLFGVIETGTRRVVDSALAAVDHGAAAVVVTVPFYVVPQRTEILAHFAAVRRALTVPVIAYDIPSATHVHLDASTTIALAESGDVAGLKDSSGDLTKLRAVLAGTAHLEFPVATGSETFTDLALLAGAVGAVPGLANVDVGGYVRLYEAVQRGDLRSAMSLQQRLSRLFEITTVADRSRIGPTAGALGAFKSAMVHLGLIGAPDLWPPLDSLNEDEQRVVRRIVDRHRQHEEGAR